ncbi:protein-tyrosine phosphatase family protein [Amycolatopsis sp. RTGN1]|uniref:protein-tyrosine phosphatase family protein n=1 Tax=Amycolatopsis ponsaeliensis TaxID=2992142 RepID=UPI00254D23EB|nr:dual specificity protein phosphatase family protein [Amycolatopsis sp. RTGN1]
MVQRGRGQLSWYTDDPAWNEVRPGLWIGGHTRFDATGEVPVVVAREFDVVISLYRREGHGPPDDVEHHCVPIPDGPLSPEQLEQVTRLSVLAAEAVRAGRKTLVRCHAGYNRSGLVVARTLVELGLGVTEAIALVRARRSPRVLHNELFVRYLGNELAP